MDHCMYLEGRRSIHQHMLKQFLIFAPEIWFEEIHYVPYSHWQHFPRHHKMTAASGHIMSDVESTKIGHKSHLWFVCPILLKFLLFNINILENKTCPSFHSFSVSSSLLLLTPVQLDFLLVIKQYLCSDLINLFTLYTCFLLLFSQEVIAFSSSSSSSKVRF